MKIPKTFFLLLMGFLYAQSIWADQFQFANGDQLTGTIVGESGGSFIIETEMLGEVKVPRKAIQKYLTKADLALPQTQSNETMTDKKPDRWSGSTSVGGVRRRGNVNSTNLTWQGEVKHAGDMIDVTGKAKVFYAEKDRKMSAQESSASLKVDIYVDEEKKLFHFYQFEAERNRFANIDYRLMPSAGLGYWMDKTGHFRSMAEIGVGYAKTLYRDETENLNEMNITPHLYLELKLPKGASLTEDVYVYPSLTDMGEYRLKSETILQSPLAKDLYLELKIIDQYNSAPGRNTKSNDMRMVTGIKYKF